jgi:pyruvate kinase
VVVAGEEDARGEIRRPAVLGPCSSPARRSIADGRVRLRVERVEARRALCEVVTGGSIEAHKGVNVPGVQLPVPSLTEKDLSDLDFALELGVDYVALSFVRSRADVTARLTRPLAASLGSRRSSSGKLSPRSTTSSTRRTRS